MENSPKPLTYREVHALLPFAPESPKAAVAKKADRLLRLKALVAARKWAERKAMRRGT